MANIIIREAVPDDAPNLLAYLRTIAEERDNGIMMVSAKDVKWTEAEERDLIAKHADTPNHMMYVAVDTAIGEQAIVGQMGLHGHHRPVMYWSIGLGITIAKDYRNQGLGTRMMQTAIDWCEQQPEVVRLYLQVFSNNPRARHVYEKLGFVLEGTHRYAAFKHGEYLDMHTMAYLFADKLRHT